MKVLVAERIGPAHEAVACRVRDEPPAPGEGRVSVGMRATPFEPVDP